MNHPENSPSAAEPIAVAAPLAVSPTDSEPVGSALAAKLVPLPFIPPGQWWKALLGPALSLAIIAAVLVQLRKLDWHQVWSVVPSSPLIWTVLAAG